MINILRDPAWSGIAALIAITALGIYIVVEREKLRGLFPSRNTVTATRQFAGGLLWIIISIVLALLPLVLMVLGDNVPDLTQDPITNGLLDLLVLACSYGIPLGLYVYIEKIFKPESKTAGLPIDIHIVLFFTLTLFLGIVAAYRFFIK